MPTDNLDSIIRVWNRATAIENRPIIESNQINTRCSMGAIMEQADEDIARIRNRGDLDFESMFATVISEYMTQNNLDLTQTLTRLGFTETSLIFAISRWFRNYTRS